MILDPDYARAFSIIRCTAHMYNYATCLHGSYTRDLDVLLVPWTDRAIKPAHELVKIIALRTDMQLHDGDPKEHAHGRKVWTLRFPGAHDPRWIDLGVMPIVQKLENKDA
ncbi:MAG: hypothetical protein JO269_09785 [Burkholderiaceae bacterium]|nr:hypothetical protein [Burkholderiaceae bacterium]